MTEVSAQREMTREEVATYLREFADKLHPSGHRGEDPQSERGGRRSGTDEQGGNVPGDDEHRSEGEDGSAERVREERTDAAEELRDDDADSERGDGRDASGAAGGESARGEGATSPSAGEKVTFMVGNESATIDPPGNVEFEMIVDSDSSLMSSDTRETVAFELHWNSEEVTSDDELDVR